MSVNITVPSAGAYALAMRISRAADDVSEALAAIESETRRTSDHWLQHRNIIPASNIARRSEELFAAQARLEELTGVARFTLPHNDIETLLIAGTDDLEIKVAS